jgi:hypothetical protein
MNLFELFERIKDPVDIAARAGKMYGKEKNYGYDNSDTVPEKYIPLKNFDEEWVSAYEEALWNVYNETIPKNLSAEEIKKLRKDLEKEASSIKNVPINKLYAGQPFVRIEDVEILKDKIASAKEITVVLYSTKLFIRDGHHAVLAARLRGETTVPAKVIDLDYLEDKYL